MAESLRIGEAGAKGKGVFATEKFQAGDLVIDYQGKEEWIWDIPEEVWEFTFQVDYDRYILPEKGSFGWYLNHSCEPNCVILGRTRVVALSLVEKGEEMTIDYSTNVGWDGFAMECRCGSPQCRKMIRSYRHLDQQLKVRYGACVSRFLLEKTAGSARTADSSP
ncbi:MAG: SET domain-containing protein-lysine N-methyltransferase [Thaumarchaeota archaeon]|nr:SET domain-containing protein-lysine N-methyltransferase [Nitrososphaerota archaeon]